VLATDMPYAGQQARTVKALSDEDIAALRKGEGMGMAKAAELEWLSRAEARTRFSATTPTNRRTAPRPASDL